ncbi:YfhO family protein [Lentilactobacillus sp. Marseille-Q4993]|uniref:YfhO family protein n=1 Tax=Lentilactobacillus sp. Marseille-Q4993 TaxID=3039492 RepID=UPI0024BC317E|nr:YfhO family protein [Lentilactobacillus sp. Marseille-Q4993]
MYAIYTAIFLFICLLTYSLPWLAGKSLIWNVDGIAQHFPILAQFQSILQGTSHQSLSSWSWHLGTGGDLLTTLAFYVVGDPFSYLIALFPASQLELGYQVLILVRLYFVGLAFLAWANRLSFSKHSKLIGALIYTFSGYNFYVSMHHPFFLMPMMLFPMLLLGIEEVLQKRRWAPLAIATGLTLISNFYFAYILAVGSAVYLVVRMLKMRDNHERVFASTFVLNLTKGLGVGLLTAGFILMPTLLSVFQSPRTMYHAKFANGLMLYPLNYYLNLPNQLITSTTIKGFWFVINISGIAILAAIYVIYHFKTYKYLASVLCLIAVAVLFPQVSAAINAMSTPSNRWLFLAVLPLALATMIFVDNLQTLTAKDLILLTISVLVLIGLTWITQGFTMNMRANDLLAYGFLLLLLVLFAGRVPMHVKPTYFIFILTSIVVINVISNGQGWLSPNNSRNTNQELVSGAATKWLHDYFDGAETYFNKSKSFFRTTTTHDYYPHKTAGNNIPTFLGSRDINSYYSIQNGHVYRFNESLDNPQAVANGPVGQGDNRTTLLNLISVKYLFAKTDIVKKPQAVPYGFHYVRHQNSSRIIDYPEKPVSGLSNHSGTVLLKNDLALPLIYTQSKVISDKQYKSLTPIQREQSLLNGVNIANPSTQFANASVTSPKTVSYQAQLFKDKIINTPIKAVLYRMRHSANPRYRETAEQYPTDLPQHKHAIWSKATGVNPNGKPLQKLIKQNKQVLATNATANSDGLHLMTSDAQGRNLSYRLKLNNAAKYKNSELYLVIDGVKATTHTTKDRIDNLTAHSIVSGKPVSKLAKVNRLRTALHYPDLGAYTLTASLADSSNSIRQLPISNLSDYKNRQHIVLNLGFSKKTRPSILLNFNGVKSLHFKHLKVVAVPFNKQYNRKITKIQKTGLRNLKVADNKITGQTDSQDHKRVMVSSIPYSTGWNLTVDNKPVKTFIANQGFIGAYLPAGKHNIKLKYITPGFKFGIFLTVVGLLWLLGHFILVIGIKFIRQTK